MPKITKEQLKEYLTDNWDVTFDNIVEDLKVEKRDHAYLKKLLAQLVYEGWINESQCLDHKRVEYDPGEAQQRMKKPTGKIDWSRHAN
jgi:hypothetical protein